MENVVRILGYNAQYEDDVSNRILELIGDDDTVVIYSKSDGMYISEEILKKRIDNSSDENLICVGYDNYEDINIILSSLKCIDTKLNMVYIPSLSYPTHYDRLGLPPTIEEKIVKCKNTKQIIQRMRSITSDLIIVGYMYKSVLENHHVFVEGLIDVARVAIVETFIGENESDEISD